MKTVKTVVHTFKLGDVDDPELYAAEPIYKWQCTDIGKWVMEKSVTIPVFVRNNNILDFYYTYNIIAEFTEEDHTYFTLKYK